MKDREGERGEGRERERERERERSFINKIIIIIVTGAFFIVGDTSHITAIRDALYEKTAETHAHAESATTVLLSRDRMSSIVESRAINVKPL